MQRFRVHLMSLVMAGSISLSAATVSATRFIPASPVNLDAFGLLDYAHWGLTYGVNFNHKSGANLISNFTPVFGNGGLDRIDDDNIGYSWAAGTPTETVSDTPTGLNLYGGGVGSGFQFTVAASIQTRWLRIWVGTHNDTGQLDVSLSDGSAAAVRNIEFNSGGNFHVTTAFLIEFSAASADQTLSVSWTSLDGTGNVTLQAAALTDQPPQPAINIACVGDSITYGEALNCPPTQCYPTVMQSLLGPGYQVYNFGRTGATMVSDGDLPYVSTTQYTASNAFRSDIVLLMLGSNDAKPYNWDLEKFKADTIAMIQHYADLPSHPQVYICTICPVIPPGDYDIVPEALPPVVDAIKLVAGVTSTPLIHTYPAMDLPETYYTDRVHPNKNGAIVLAQTMFSVLNMSMPTALTAISISSSENRLSWTHAADNSEQIEIERRTGSSGAFSVLASVAPGVSEFSDHTVTGGTQYTYRVRASNAAGQTPFSNEVTLTTSVFPVNPVPVLKAVAPLSAVVHGPAFELTLRGIGFVQGSVVFWDGLALPTTWRSEFELSALVSSNLLKKLRTVPITVFNPAPGGGASNRRNFAIVALTPPKITSSLKAAAALNVDFTYNVSATGSQPMVFHASPLPPGLVLKGNTISGKPLRAGAIEVSLTALNSAGKDQRTLLLSISGAKLHPPVFVSAPTASPTTPRVGTPVTFNAFANDPDGDLLVYEWNFGDGSSASGHHVSHSYGSQGTFTVTVLVRDATLLVRKSLQVTVTENRKEKAKKRSPR